MKLLITIFIIFTSGLTFSQSSDFKVGDQIEFFDGVDWIDGEIGSVNPNGTYLIYVNGNKSKTKILKKDDIQALFMDEDKIITTTVTKTVETYIQKFNITDIVKYTSGNEVIESEVLNINEENKYQVYGDNQQTKVIWIEEDKLTYVRSKNTFVHPDFKKGTLVLVNTGEVWIESEIIEAQNEMFQVYYDSEKSSTRWVSSKELKLR
jgi:hypothetical protein